MGIKRNAFGKLAACALVCSGGVAPSDATTLTFDFTPVDSDCGGNGCIPSDHGSRIGDTPNVVVSYQVNRQGERGFSVWNSGYGELFKALGHVAFNVPGEIVLTPDPGYGVRVNGFSIATWVGGSYQTAIAIYDSNGSVANPNLFSFAGTLSGSTSISPMTNPVVSFGQVRIYVSNIGSTGIDNLSFEQFPADIALTLSKAAVAGCKSVSGRVLLPSPAPAGGAIVTITDTLLAATPPATVRIAEGATSKSFTIKTVPVASNQSGTVTASVGSASSSVPLTIRPMGISTVKLSPTTVVGGQNATGTATLECAAGPGPVTVDLSTNNAAVASPVAPTVVVPQALKSQTFTVATNPVLSKSSAMIAGEAGKTTKSLRLNIVPAAAVSPTRLAFGGVAVGQTSGTMVATLRNDGVVSFAVNGISLTGSYASWYSQTNNCPASLAAGASCTISVGFTPQAALTRSAKLSIATNATSTPLGVALSGTGI